MGADVGAHTGLDVIGEAFGDILHGATDGVAAIKRTLRTAEYLDALEVIDVENRGLGPVEVNVIDIDTDTGLETRHRILLADTANEGGDRTVGAARDFKGQVRRGLGNAGNVAHAGIQQGIAGVGGDGDRHVDQPLVTPAGGDHNAIHYGFVTCGLRIRRSLRQCRRAG